MSKKISCWLSENKKEFASYNHKILISLINKVLLTLNLESLIVYVVGTSGKQKCLYIDFTVFTLLHGHKCVLTHILKYETNHIFFM